MVRNADLLDGTDGRFLRRVAADTWRSMAALTDPATGLPADNIDGTLDPASRSRYTSPTNIGALLWSTVAAQRLGLIPYTEAVDVLDRTVRSVDAMERHESSGMFFNWYDEHTGRVLDTTPTGQPIHRFLSSVDNGWLAVGLIAASAFGGEHARHAETVRAAMDFGVYLDPVRRQIRGGFWLDGAADRVVGNYLGGAERLYYTPHCYGTLNTEPRMATYLGIAAGQIPPEAYFSAERDPDPAGPDRPTRVYRGVPVPQGARVHRGMRLVPTWGGSMFEALMVPLFVPEEDWGPRSWGLNHPLYVRAQLEHGLAEAEYGYWGFSPSNNPAGGYREYGVPGLGMRTTGYTSDQERTAPDAAAGNGYGDGVVTPHASFLALRYAPDEAVRNLRRLARDFDSYGPGGFFDAIAVRSGQVSRSYLALDQGMTMAALGNALGADVLRAMVSGGSLRVLRPLMAIEDFGAAARAASTA